MFKLIKNGVITLALIAVFMMLIPEISYAADKSVEVSGKIYELEDKSDYKFSSAESTTGNVKTYGNLTIKGDIVKESSKSGIPEYVVGSGNLTVSYTYSDSLLKANDDSWHLINDKGKKLDSLKLNESIGKGVLILQTSRDGVNWIDDYCQTDVFNQIPVQKDSFYETQDVQLINGCYYRVIVAYETGMRTEHKKIGFDKYEYKKTVELYTFFVKTSSADESAPANTLRYSLGKVVKSDKSYSTAESIGAKDAHYGWTLGNFFVSGYTSNTKDSSGNPIFLKNVGDTVTLWFNLQQNINALNGNNKLSIYSNSEGYDEKFQLKKTEFGRGTLIIRYTDYENVSHDPIVYTNYLEANTSLNADTKVQLFDEGDYEVSLDYEILEDGIGPADKYTHYCISFKFAVRNGNCMVYPFDVITGAELTNTSVTQNGFYLDLAKSRYLKLFIKKEVMKEGADGLSEDTRFNSTTKDGDKYTDEGIYTITVNNEYTGQQTVKKIYVGDNDVLTAFVVTGKSISEIKELVAQGAVINEDGTITIPVKQETIESEVPEEIDTIEETSEVAEENDTEANEETVPEPSPAVEKSESTGINGLIPAVGGVGAIIILALVFVLKKKNSAKKEEE